MNGYYKRGNGKAHKCCNPHTKVFNCRMYGTFNIQVPYLRITDHPYMLINNSKCYWFVKIRNKDTDQVYFGWAIRDLGSHQRENTIEVLTKKLLPVELRTAELDVEIPRKWQETTIKKWASDKYWFQTFPFSPMKKADTKLVWDTIDVIDWSGLDVLDLGCHYGYMSFEASKKGASVLGVDSNKTSLGMAETIRDNIIQQDVIFGTEFNNNPNSYDVIMYLSVHHQPDPTYSNLERTVHMLKDVARKCVFIELIMPPTFPSMKTILEADIDKIVGGEILLRYKHNVRGYRKIYHLEM